MATRALTVRLPEDEHEAIRAYAFAVDASMNDVVRQAVQEFLADPGRTEQADALLDHARDRYRVALDKLAEM